MRTLLLGLSTVLITAGCSTPSVTHPDVADATRADTSDTDATVVDVAADQVTEDTVGPGRDAAMDGPDVVDAGSPADGGRITCSTTFHTEVFRDDFNGTSVDTGRWDVVQQAPGGGTFTQITAMRRENVTVSAGVLHVASMRHCVNPTPSGAPEHPGACTGTSYYSGGWLRSVGNYAPGRGVAIFLARVPSAVRGTFPGLWVRNTDGASNYGECDLIEQWWDGLNIGSASNPDQYSATTWIGDPARPGTVVHSGGNLAGPFAGLNDSFHVWEVEWDATVPSITYYYRDAPGATRQLVRTVDQTTNGLSPAITRDHLIAVLSLGWRPYIDFAVQPLTTYHDSPDAPAPSVDPYNPDDLLVDSVVVCAP